MLRLALAITLALFFFVPEIVFAAHVPFADWPPDGFGLRGCCRPCGATIVPSWLYATGLVTGIGLLAGSGIQQMRNGK